MKADGYQQISRQHKKATGDINLIDYDELKQSFELVDNLTKMSNRLKIVGCTAFSILHCERMLNNGVCINGRVSGPDNFCVPTTNFFDNKVHSNETIADFLITGLRHQVIQKDAKSYRYALSGSIIYLLIYVNKGLFNYIIYLSEEPISGLIQTLTDQTEFNNHFDFIYTVVGRTITEEEIHPYIRTERGICFKDIVLYCNENQFSAPVLSTTRRYGTLIKKFRESEDNSPPKLESSSILPLSSLLLQLYLPLDKELNEKLFDTPIRRGDDSRQLKEALIEYVCLRLRHYY